MQKTPLWIQYVPNTCDFSSLSTLITAPGGGLEVSDPHFLDQLDELYNFTYTDFFSKIFKNKLFILVCFKIYILYVMYYTPIYSYNTIRSEAIQGVHFKIRSVFRIF